MKIYIPSQGRANDIKVRRMTPDSIKAATFVVPEAEVKDYTKALQFGDFPVIACPERGIAKTRHWIGRHADKHGHDKFLMIDDDLTFCVRIDKTSHKLKPSEPSDIKEMLAWTEKCLENYAHVSVSTRQGNNTIGPGDVRTLIRFNSRTLRYLAYQTAAFLLVEHGRVEVMEDFDVNLQLLRNGKCNVQSFWWCQDQPATGSAGGCSSYRTLEAHNAAANKIVDLHKPFVKLRTKQNKSGPAELRNRQEVTIYWQKAFQSSKQYGEQL